MSPTEVRRGSVSLLHALLVSLKLIWPRLDSGLNLLFDDRAEEQIEHEEEIEKALKRTKGKRPDRIIGLRATNRIERILNYTEAAGGDSIGDCVRVSPFKGSSQPLLFPFLILEAKSEKSSDTFSKIYLQTGFAIRALLNLQRDLLNATKENQDWSMKPLVWFLANKGEDWRVYGAYIEEREGNAGPNYRILELWAGNITYEDKALGLLLIVDYIFDWARDVYRKEVISSLLSLATNATPSLAAETDVYSTVDHLFHIDQGQDLDTEISVDHNEPFGVQHMFKFFDIANLAFRDARYMHRKLCALYITQGNLERLLCSASNSREALQFSRRLWRLIIGPEAWSVTAASLNAVEELWTGKTREYETFESPDQPFLATFYTRSYFTEEYDNYLRGHQHERPSPWDQYHELTYIAIAEDALEALRKQTEFKAPFLHLNLQTCPRVPFSWILETFEEPRFASTEDCFLAALSDCVFHSSSKRGYQGKRDSFPAHQESQSSVTTYFEPFFAKGPKVFDSSSPCRIPWAVYKRCKVGMSEPCESFLRVSQNFGKHEPRIERNRQSWYLTNKRIDLGDMNAVSVARLGKDGPGRDSQWTTRHCIFVLKLPESYSDARERGTESKVLYRALDTILWADNGSQTAEDVTKEGSTDLNWSLRILEHVSMQYQLILSLDSETNATDLPSWIGDKYRGLRSWEKAKWPYGLKETMDGIKTTGKSYHLGEVLEGLSTAFQTASDIQVAIDIALFYLKHNTTQHPQQLDSTSSAQASVKSDGEDNKLQSIEAASTQITSQPEPQPSALDGPRTNMAMKQTGREVIDLADSINRAKRMASISPGEIEDEAEMVSKRRRIEERAE